MNIFKTKNKGFTPLEVRETWRWHKQKKPLTGFTIIELIVVIAIIAVLSAIVVTNVTAYQKKARNAKRLSDIKNYTTALEAAYEKNVSYPSSGATFYCCLGRGYTNPDGKCWGAWQSECTNNLDLANDILDEWIPLPVTNNPIMYDGYDYKGYLYRSSDGKSYSIFWFLEGFPVSCGLGTAGPLNYSGNTFCSYNRRI